MTSDFGFGEFVGVVGLAVPNQKFPWRLVVARSFDEVVVVVVGHVVWGFLCVYLGCVGCVCWGCRVQFPDVGHRLGLVVRGWD